MDSRRLDTGILGAIFTFTCLGSQLQTISDESAVDVDVVSSSVYCMYWGCWFSSG